MHNNIKKMIAGRIQPVKMIVKGKREKGDKTGRPEIPDSPQVTKIPYGGIAHDKDAVIVMKRGNKG